MSSGKKSIQVAIKVRPLLRKEKEQQSLWRVVENSIQLTESQADPIYFGKNYIRPGHHLTGRT